MLISLREYAATYGKSPDTLRRYAEQGRFATARKIGRNWVIEDDEQYPCRQRKWTVASMFSGCGGLDLGFVGGFEFLGKEYPKQPFEIVWANEINGSACSTYRHNLGEIIQGDVFEVMSGIPQRVDVVIGGFPCQDISINGKMRGIKGARSSTYKAIVEAVGSVRPKLFVAENVGSLLLRTNSDSYKTIVDDFGKLGYKIFVNRYDASEYGVPQTRDRVFIIGLSDQLEDYRPPAPTTKDEPITAKEAIDDLREHPWDEPFSHIWSKAKKSAEQGGRQLLANRPGYTIRAECHGNIQFHYELPRRISMREAARIQSFPDDFIFCAKLRETERQIGNAVPPVLAWHIARSVADTLVGGSANG